nr:hypothetical protein GCM10025732_10220 [Glycomyces mayteni]
MIVPVLFAAYVAFFRWNGLGGVPTDFVGLENFRNLIQDEVFLGDLWRLGLIVVLSLIVQLPISFGLAMLLHQRFPGAPRSASCSSCPTCSPRPSPRSCSASCSPRGAASPTRSWRTSAWTPKSGGSPTATSSCS